jgi:hypothetical protein
MKKMYHVLYALLLTTLFAQMSRAQCPVPVITTYGTPCAETFILTAYDGIAAGLSNALTFDGVDDNVQMADFNLGTANFTVEAWVRPADNNGGYIVSNRGTDWGAAGNWFVMSRSGTTGKTEVELGASNSFYTVLAGNTVVPLNTWTHIALVRQGASFKIYINGLLDAVFNETIVRNFSGGNNAGTLGGWPSVGQGYFHGAIDQVRIWTIAKTPLQMANDFHQTITGATSGLQNNYTMGSISGTTVTDSASANNGTMFNGVGFETPSSAPVSDPQTTYAWSSGQTTPAINPSVSGNYTVNVTNALGCTAAASYEFNGAAVTLSPGATIASAASVCSGTTVNLSIANQTYNLNYSHQWQSATSQAGTYSNIAGATSATYSTAAGAALWYRDNVTCSGITVSSTPIQITIKPIAECYCVPVIYGGCQYSTVISRVILNTLDNNTGDSCTGNAYVNYANSGITTSLRAGVTYNTTVFTGENEMGYAVFIDFNDDGSFGATERVGYSDTVYTVGSFPVAISCTANPGVHQMRIRGEYYYSGSTITPCGEGQYGEIEDYKVTILPTMEIPYNGVDDDCDNIIDETGILTTTLLPTSCGTTLASIGSLIGIQTVAGHPVTGYRIRVTNGAEVQTIETNVPHFTMPQFASYDYAKTYTVEIQLQRAGSWQINWGTPCFVSTPAILASGAAGSVNPSQCGVALAKINTLIATTSLAGVTGYRFRVTNLTDEVGPNMVQTIDRTQNWFSLQMLTRYNYGTTYRIEVAVKTTGTFGGYGAPCEVSSPSSPSLTNCAGTVALPTTAVACSNISGVTQYRFQITRQSDNAASTIDRSVNWFNFNMVPSAIFTAGTMYTIRIAVMTTGTWSPYGDACEIMAPGGTSKGVSTASSQAATTMFKAMVHPNPFTATFTVDVQSSGNENIELKIYDMLGRLVETRNSKVSEISQLELGQHYPSGVYQVIVGQGDDLKTLRVVKR